jgi:hypothetical protein
MIEIASHDLDPTRGKLSQLLRRTSNGNEPSPLRSRAIEEELHDAATEMT